MNGATKKLAALCAVLIFAACASVRKANPEPESAFSPSFCDRVTAVAHLEILGAEVVETLGGDKGGYVVHRVSGKVVAGLKGGFRQGELIEYYNFIEAGLQYPPPGELIVFLNQSANQKTEKLEWVAVENSEFIYTEKLLSEIKQCIAAKPSAHTH